MSDSYEAIIEFWLGDASSSAEELKRRSRVWFSADPKLDQEIELRFGTLLGNEAAEVYDSWQATPRGRLALIILFDQFPRNIHRGTADAYAYDEKALDLSQTGIDAGMDQSLEPLERMFFYMPLQHAESIKVQDKSVELFTRLAEAVSPTLQETFLTIAQFAELHRDIIEQYGRFPHRNAVLGRENTAEEDEYLAGDAPDFGQS